MMGTRLVLFSEVNSKFGFPILRQLLTHPEISVAGLVTSPSNKVCSYYVGEEDQVDLEQEAKKYDIPVFRPRKVNDPALHVQLKALQSDYFLIGNYQQIFKPPLLEVPKHATINFHPSPLPRYAGWAPFFWMAKYAERYGGVSAIIVNPQIDEGPLLAQRSIQLTGTETALEIRDCHFQESFALLQDVIPCIIRHELSSVPQDLSLRTYFGKPGEHEYWLDFNSATETLLRTIRACYRLPGAYAQTVDGEKITILSAERVEISGHADPGTVRVETSRVLVATRDGWLRIKTVSREGQEVLLHVLDKPMQFCVSSPVTAYAGSQ